MDFFVRQFHFPIQPYKHSSPSLNNTALLTNMKFIVFALVVTALVAVVCADQSIEDEVKDIIKNNKIVVFSKSYCPYCKYSISTLQELRF